MSESHRARGLHGILERPAIYDWVMRALGGAAARRRFVDEFLKPHPDAKLLDAGCGTAALLDHLPPGVVYVGSDVNPAYLASARRRYGGRGTFVLARAGDDAEVGDGFDFVVAMALLHHLDDDEVHRLLESAARRLRPGGAFVSIDPTVHPKQSRLARLLVSLDRGRRVRSPEGYRALLDAHFAHVDARVVTDLLPFPYSHYVARAR